MRSIDRRTFLKMAGAGSAVAAASAVPAVGALGAKGRGETLAFRAVAGLPVRPLPTMGTHVVEGSVDVGRGTGMVTSRVLAGHPDHLSDIALPGLSRLIRITDASRQGSRLLLQGMVEDRSQLRPGESSVVRMVVDLAARTVRAPLAGREVLLTLA